METLISSHEYRQLGLIQKDKVDICRDCEFRYFCHDQRIPAKEEDGLWYHTQECAYNPYTAQWKDEEGYITVQKWRKEYSPQKS